jgi:hypothetical protein
MTRQGPELAIERLHPEFAIRLADSLREARESGLPNAGIFSAYRPPAFGIGGFSDKFNSLHAYGLAVDLAGIGGPGSSEAKHWHEIAARHGVICPYGPHNGAEWNHCQPTSLKAVLENNPLRETITAAGPVSLEGMFEAGNALVESRASVVGAVAKEPTVRATVQASVVVEAKRRPPRDRDEDEDDDKPQHKRNGRVANVTGGAGKDSPLRATAQASASAKAKRPPRNREEDEDEDDDRPKHKRNGRVAERRAGHKEL